MYRNNRDGTFTDVTEKAGVAAGGYGQGVAVGDYDRDGFADLYVTQYGRSILYHNNGDGTFTDVTAKARRRQRPGGPPAPCGSTMTTTGNWIYSLDNSTRFSKAENKPCGIHDDGKHHYCIPQIYQPMPSWLFHNNGDGTFTDVSKDSGIADHLGKAWGVVVTDINNDGWIDLFVTNDTTANFLFLNSGKGTFTEIGTEAGVAFSANGRPRSGMGADAADFNEDGWQDLFVANIDRENFAIYQNNRDNTFDDLAIPSGIAKSTKFMSGWGA